jgi:uncharacterized protein (DUF849 family)
MDCLLLDGDLKPDLASLTLSSLNFVTGPSINSPEVIEGLLKIMSERGITPELEIFDLGMVNVAHVLMKKGILSGPIVANLFLGNIAGAQATLGELAIMADRLPKGTYWSVAGIGHFRDRAHALGLAAGAGVRVGLEDGIFLDDMKSELATNEALVNRVHALGDALGLESMSPGEFRTEILGRLSERGSI